MVDAPEALDAVTQELGLLRKTPAPPGPCPGAVPGAGGRGGRAAHHGSRETRPLPAPGPALGPSQVRVLLELDQSVLQLLRLAQGRARPQRRTMRPGLCAKASRSSRSGCATSSTRWVSKPFLPGTCRSTTAGTRPVAWCTGRTSRMAGWSRKSSPGTGWASGWCARRGSSSTSTLEGPMAQKIFGIDLGTTNSCLAVMEAGGPRVIDIDGEPIVPSVVSLDRQTGSFLVGRRARNRQVLEPAWTVRSIKRRMGQRSRYSWETGSSRPRRSRPRSSAISWSGARRPWASRWSGRSSPCPPTSATPSAAPPSGPESWRASRSSASSTSPRRRPWSTTGWWPARSSREPAGRTGQRPSGRRP